MKKRRSRKKSTKQGYSNIRKRSKQKTNSVDKIEEYQFTIRDLRVYKPQIRSIPDDWPKTKRHKKFFIYANDAVIEKIKNHAAQRNDIECFGLLLGNAYIDSDIRVLWIHLQDTVAAENTRSDAVSVEVSTQEFKRLNDKVDKVWDRTRGEVRKIGWYHSHPDIGVFMSATDKKNQKLFYNQEWQIALVVDPVRDEIGFFRGKRSTACQYHILSSGKEVENETVHDHIPPSQPTLKSLSKIKRFFRDLVGIFSKKNS